MYQDDILKDYSPQHEGISTVLSLSNPSVSRVLALVMETSAKTRGLAGS